MVCTAIMAFQTTGFALDLWRFIAGIGIGVELVTIDTYISELIPRARARPRLLPSTSSSPSAPCRWWRSSPGCWCRSQPFGLDGWRWVVLIGSVGAVIVVWFLRSAFRKARAGSPATAASRKPSAIVARHRGQGRRARLGRRCRRPAADRREAKATGTLRRDLRAALPQPHHHAVGVQLLPDHRLLRLRRLGADPADRPGHPHHHSLEYAFIIAIANPFGPLLGTLFADRMERKWQIVGGAACMLACS